MIGKRKPSPRERSSREAIDTFKQSMSMLYRNGLPGLQGVDVARAYWMGAVDTLYRLGLNFDVERDVADMLQGPIRDLPAALKWWQ